MKTPIALEFDGKTVAKIISYSYVTPWATGMVEFEDHSLFKKLVALTSLLSFDLDLENLGHRR
jgi:hypothetical protein